jgi:hypothetical protein
MSTLLSLEIKYFKDIIMKSFEWFYFTFKYLLNMKSIGFILSIITFIAIFETI